MKYSIEFPKLKISTELAKEIPLEKILEEEIETVRTRIVQSTTGGKTADGGGLKPYKPSYIKQIDSGKIAGKAPGNHTPNLTATQTLLRSFAVRKIKGGVEMSFEGTHAPARKVSDDGAARKRKKAQGLGDTNRPKSAKQSSKVASQKSNATKGARIGKAKKAPPAAASNAGKGGRDVPNAVIAAAQYKMGRTGWMAFSKSDLERIAKRVSDEIDKAIKTLFLRNTESR